MLLVAFPTPGQDTTEFEFKYWNGETPKDYSILIGVIIGVVVVLLILGAGKLFKKYRKDQNMV